MPESALRRRLGLLVAACGVLHLAPSAFVWLSALGPAPLSVSGRVWSRFYYAHFVALAAGGLALQAYAGSRAKVFYGGPLIDFLIGVAAFMVLETACILIIGGSGPSWPALLPGAFLLGFGLRLSTGARLLNP